MPFSGKTAQLGSQTQIHQGATFRKASKQNHRREVVVFSLKYLNSYRLKLASKIQGIWWYLLLFWQIGVLLGDSWKEENSTWCFGGKAIHISILLFAGKCHSLKLTATATGKWVLGVRSVFLFMGKRPIFRIYVGSTPHPVPVKSEGLVRDNLLSWESKGTPNATPHPER